MGFGSKLRSANSVRYNCLVQAGRRGLGAAFQRSEQRSSDMIQPQVQAPCTYYNIKETLTDKHTYVLGFTCVLYVKKRFICEFSLKNVTTMSAFYHQGATLLNWKSIRNDWLDEIGSGFFSQILNWIHYKYQSNQFTLILFWSGASLVAQRQYN